MVIAPHRTYHASSTACRAALVSLCLTAGAAAALPAQAATSGTVHVDVATDLGPAAGVMVSSGRTVARTDEKGRTLLRLPAGRVLVIVRHLGFAPDSARFELRGEQDTSIVFQLLGKPTLIAPVMVSSTRTERRVEDEPLRVEVLAGEDVSEKTLMRPSDLTMLLTEMSGVRVQVTSPSLGAATVRVQGLRGRYTQILTDGLPLYGAQAGSFGLLEVAPLDLRQAEVIKGSASALYGPAALGGVLNLVSRRTPDSSETLVNATARGGTDLAAFGAREFSPGVGATTILGAHSQRSADLDGDGWSDLPGFRRVEVRPRLFASDADGRTLMLTLGASAEDRGGGSAAPVTDVANAFPESLTTRHLDMGGVAHTRLSGIASVAARVAGNVQERVRRFGAQRERERMTTLFGEVTTTVATGAHTLLVGAVAQFDRYRNRDAPRFDDQRSTPALFLQHTYAAASWLSMQLNGRCDASSVYGTICTPRLSLLGHAGHALSLRLSGGAGWSAPMALTEETEVVGLTRVAGPLRVAAERARTASLDIATTRGPLEVNATVFVSRVTDLVGLRTIATDGAGGVEFVNASGPSRVRGLELFAVYHLEPVSATAFYSATRASETSPESGQRRESPLVPRASAGLDVAFEEDESGTRVGVEVLYTGPQALGDNPYRSVSPGYATLGLLASQRIGRASVYLNLDNLTNIRQSRFDPLRRPSPSETGRRTVDAWAPLGGRTVNGGVRVRI